MNRISVEALRRRWGRLIGPGLLTLLWSFSPGPLPAQTNSAASDQPPPAPRRPSIILILADNVGYGDLGCYGQTKIKTPHLDQLAADGIRFTSFYAASPEAEPARAALLTGLEPRHSRAGFNQPLAADAVTIATMLKDQGYSTGLIGVWGLGDTGPFVPAGKGFDNFLGFLSAAHARDYFTDRLWSDDSKTDFHGQQPIVANSGGQRNIYIPDLLTRAAVNFVTIHKPETMNRQRPFFLCLAYPIPHAGLSPTNPPYADQSWPEAARDRAAMITRMDTSIGQLLSKLKDLRIDTNTVVLFTSVNGPEKEAGVDPAFFSSAGPWRWEPGSVYEGGLRMPMIVRWPAKTKAGQVSDLPWAGWDLLPTAAEIALGKPPEKIDGISVLPTLTGKKQSERHETFYWESGRQRAARMGDWKLVQTETNAAALYNLKTNPLEDRDVARKNADVVKKLEAVLERK